MIKLTVVDQAKAAIDLHSARAVVVAINRALTTPDGVINLKLIDDAAMTSLNEQYSGKVAATDVLSFSYIEDGAAPIAGDLGDVAISLETAQRQAAAAGTDLGTEVALLVLHGCLHVLGYDHTQPAERRRLDQLQSQLMTTAALPYRNFQWAL